MQTMFFSEKLWRTGGRQNAVRRDRKLGNRRGFKLLGEVDQPVIITAVILQYGGMRYHMRMIIVIPSSSL